MYIHLHQDLLLTAHLRDKVRLLSEGRQHSGARLSVVPNTNLGSHFDKGDLYLLTHFHLGLPLLPAAAAGTPCDNRGQPLDVLGDHLVSCPKAGAWRRHNSFCTALQAIAESSGLLVDRETVVSVPF